MRYNILCTETQYSGSKNSISVNCSRHKFLLASKPGLVSSVDYEYVPEACVWELTLRCNMRCIHCGSSAGKSRENELTIDECLKVADDLLDLIGESKKTGKGLGSDIREGWVTLPLIFALKNEDGKSKQHFKNILGGDVAPSDIEKVVKFVKNYGGIEYAEQKARGYVQKSIAILRGLDGLPMKPALEELANLAAARDK